MTLDLAGSQEEPISFRLPQKKRNAMSLLRSWDPLVWPRDPYYWLTGWFTVSLSVSVTKQPQCHRKVSADCKAGCVLCNEFTLGMPDLSLKDRRRPIKSFNSSSCIKIKSVFAADEHLIIWGFQLKGVTPTLTDFVKLELKMIVIVHITHIWLIFYFLSTKKAKLC